MDGCPGTISGTRSRSREPQDRDSDRDSNPRDSRDRNKNLRDSPGTKARGTTNPDISGQESGSIPGYSENLPEDELTRNVAI